MSLFTSTFLTGSENLRGVLPFSLLLLPKLIHVCLFHLLLFQPKKWIARARVVAHDLDLAIIEVDNEAFWTGVQTVELAPSTHVVDLYSEVSAIGFPTGGSTVCVTKGVISRFDAHLYAHPACCGVRPSSRNSPGNIFILQVDSAINPGNSGGPAVDEEVRRVTQHMT
jgi:S1-C subfamily serine protease